MVYDWDGKEQTCRRLYVDEKQSLDEVMEYFRNEGFAPSKRAFQTQFKRWAFPTKHSPAYKNDTLVARIKELWEQNYDQRQILETLKAEGFDISERELNRVRGRNRWLLRVPNKNTADTTITHEEAPDNPPVDNDLAANISGLEQAIMNAHTVNALPELTADMPAELKRKRDERKAALQEDSDTRWASRKRRRRTRGWAGLPADPPQPPRFPSELTLDEGKALLGLDNAGYRTVRDSFEQICLEAGIMKKTLAGPEKWNKAKSDLIEKHEELRQAFSNTSDADKKTTALDLLCMDVTKRLRTMDTRMTLAEAKNILGLNPDQSREVREKFYDLLQENFITSKLEAGDETWSQLKNQWIESSPHLKNLGLSATPTEGELNATAEADQQAPQPKPPRDPLLDRKARALEVLGRDVMKRLRDDRYKRDPTSSGRQKSKNGPGPGPAPPRMPSAAAKRKPDGQDLNQAYNTIPAQTVNDRAPSNETHSADLQIDPSLLLAAAENMSNSRGGSTYDSTAATVAASGYGPASMEVAGGAYAAMGAISASLGPGGSAGTYSSLDAGVASDSAPNQPPTTIASFFKLSSQSPVRVTPDMWMGFVTSAATVQELYQEANKPFEGRGMKALRVEGVVRREDVGEEVGFPIDRDDELRSYLAHVMREMSGKAAFSVLINRAYS